MLTLKDAFEFIDWTLWQSSSGGGSIPRVIGRQLVNMAGDFLVSAHPWRWTMGGQLTLTIPDGQDFVELPGDFMELRGWSPSESLVGNVTLVTPQELVSRRSWGNAPSSGYFYATIVYPLDADGIPKPRLDLYPPGTATNNEIVIYYRRGWRPVTTDEEALSMPPWMEDLYLQVLMHYARGFHEEDEATLAQRLALEVQGPLWRAKVRRDGSTAKSLGPLTGGAIRQTPGHFYSALRNTVQDPQ